MAKNNPPHDDALEFQVREPGGQVIGQARTRKAADGILEANKGAELWRWNGEAGGFQPVE